MFTDEEIITFISNNYQNGQALEDFFSQLKQPLSTQVLTWKPLLNLTGKTTNFLAYTSEYDCFKCIVELSTEEALITALEEPSVNTASPSPMEAILYLSSSGGKEDNVLRLFEKINPKIINLILFQKTNKGISIFTLAFGMHKDVFTQLLSKINTELLNVGVIRDAQAIMTEFCNQYLKENKTQFGLNFISNVTSVLTVLDPETIDILALKPIMVESSLCPSVLFIIFYDVIEKDGIYFSLWMQKVSSESIGKFLSLELGVPGLYFLIRLPKDAFSKIIEKVPQQDLNQTVKQDALNIINILQKEELADNLKYIVSVLDTEVIDFLVSYSVRVEGIEYPSFLASIVCCNEPGDKLIHQMEYLLQRTSQAQFLELVKVPFKLLPDGSPSVLLATLLGTSKKVTDVVLSRLDKNFINDVLCNELISGLPFLLYALAQIKPKSGLLSYFKSKPRYKEKQIESVIHILNTYISVEALQKSLSKPYGQDEHGVALQDKTSKARIDFLNQLALVPTLLNAVMHKLLEASLCEPLVLPDICVTHLNELNIKRYLAQLPQVNVSDLLSIQSRLIKNTERQASFVQKLTQAGEVTKSPLKAYQCLTSNHFPGELARIVIDYMIEDKVIQQSIGRSIASRQLLPMASTSIDDPYLLAVTKSISNWGNSPSDQFPRSFHWQPSDSQKKLKAETKKYGFECKKVQSDKEDKNGFLHAILDQLHMQGFSYLARDSGDLRAKVEHYIKSHIALYKGILINNHNTLPDRCMMLALSRALNITIVIARSDAAFDVYKQKSSVLTLYIGYEFEKRRYRSLAYNPNIKSIESMQAVVDKAKIDEEAQKLVIAISSLSSEETKTSGSLPLSDLIERIQYLFKKD